MVNCSEAFILDIVMRKEWRQGRDYRAGGEMRKDFARMRRAFKCLITYEAVADVGVSPPALSRQACADVHAATAERAVLVPLSRY
jgi:hypothetical protein